MSVDDLLKIPFARRFRVQQQQIVARGRPRLIPSSGELSKDIMWFERMPWLTRSETNRKLYCWTCLLFVPAGAPLKGRIRSPYLIEIVQKHESSTQHMEAVMKLEVFITQNFRTSLRVGDKTQHNLTVERNREALKRITDAVLFAVAEKRSHGDGKYSYNTISVEGCSKFLLLLRSVDSLHSDLTDSAIDLLNKCPKIVNDLVDAMTRVLKTTIKNETHKSTYVSLMLSEHGPNAGKSQISTVVRYIKQGKVCERFIGFTNVVACKSENDMLKRIQGTLNEYSISDRFLALALDGRVLPNEALTKLITSIKIIYHYSYFVPWSSHGFGNVLLQSLSVFEECGSFLKNMSALENFFRNSRLFVSLESVLFANIPSLQSDKSYKTCPFIVFVSTYRACFIQFFDVMLKNSKSWEADDITKAVAFREFLLELHTMFLLQLFPSVFASIFNENFNFAVENANFLAENEYLFNNPRMSELKSVVGNLQFKRVWQAVSQEIDNEAPHFKLSKLRLEVTNNDNIIEYNLLFQKIHEHLLKEIDFRCSYLDRLKFCDLLNCDYLGHFNFSPELLSELMAEHGPYFQEIELTAEMAAMSSRPEFCSKSVHEILEYFAEFNLRGVFPQLYKLAEFILTLPVVPVSRDKGVSKLEAINKCSYIPETSGIPSGEVSVLCIENEMLRDVKDSALFYEDVLAKFYEVNKSLVLVQV